MANPSRLGQPFHSLVQWLTVEATGINRKETLAVSVNTRYIHGFVPFLPQTRGKYFSFARVVCYVKPVPDTILSED